MTIPEFTAAILMGFSVPAASQTLKDPTEVVDPVKLAALETAVPCDALPYGDRDETGALEFAILSDGIYQSPEQAAVNRESENKVTQGQKDLVGKVVEWTVTVRDIQKTVNGYRLIGGATNWEVVTVAGIITRNDQEKARIESLSEDQSVTIRGYIHQDPKTDPNQLSDLILVSPGILLPDQLVPAEKAIIAGLEQATPVAEPEIGDFQAIYARNSTATSFQRATIKTNYVGKTVEWELRVRETKVLSSSLQLVCYEPEGYQYGLTNTILVNLIPRNKEEIESLRITGVNDLIPVRIRGRIYKVGDHLEIRPAILVKKLPKAAVPDAKPIAPSIPQKTPKKNVWLFPDSSTRELTNPEITKLSEKELWIARNEIYARNGLIFSTPQGREFTAALGVEYDGKITDQEQVFTNMNQIEKTNVKRLKSFKK